MRMTPALMIVGGLMVFWTSVFVAVFLPALTMQELPTDNWRGDVTPGDSWTADERAGHKVYVSNGCSYCHSMFYRNIDWEQDLDRIAQRGDYVGMAPIILGTERTGPDLSQQGGLHPDNWHDAHFRNPRYTRPMSLMPSWEFLGDTQIRQVTAFIQASGLKNADERVARQKHWKQEAMQAYYSGPDGAPDVDKNVVWLHSQVPQVWREMPNPYAATDAELQRGEVVYQRYCIGCHGPVGDGAGPAKPYLDPPPLNFTVLPRHLVNNKYIGGIFYYQVMNGITGTAMPYFKAELESAKIWAVSNYLAVKFLGYADSTLEPRGIPISNEPQWQNNFLPPPPSLIYRAATSPAATQPGKETAQ
jgi:cytochrome c oxidase cbb3-type subunit II